MTYDNVDLLMIADTMMRHGGGFVRKLGQLYMAGDYQNKQKLVKAFPEYFKDYYDKAIASGYQDDYKGLKNG